MSARLSKRSLSNSGTKLSGRAGRARPRPRAGRKLEKR